MEIASSYTIPHSQPSIGPDEQAAVKAVLGSSMLSRGGVTKSLEDKLSDYLDKKYALFTGNGTQAQMLLLKAMNIGAGDEVILPTYVCDKVLKGVIAVGATPVLCDVDERGLMDEARIASKINPATKAIILVHIFGLNAWSDNLLHFNIPIIEDICQSFGHNDVRLRTGTHTQYAFTSFHGTKTIGAGEGGMLFVNDSEVFQRILEEKARSGFFTSGTDVIASIVLSIFQRYPAILERRQWIANRFNKELHPDLAEFMIRHGNDGMNFRYIIRSKGNWNHIQEAFLEKGIHVRKGVDALLHRSLGMNDELYSNAVQVFNATVSIPLLPQLLAEDISHIILFSNELHERGIL